MLCAEPLFVVKRQRESISELDRELRLGRMPFLGWFFPLRGDVPQRQVDQLGRRLVAGEMPLVANRLADLAPAATNSTLAPPAPAITTAFRLNISPPPTALRPVGGLPRGRNLPVCATSGPPPDVSGDSFELGRGTPDRPGLDRQTPVIDRSAAGRPRLSTGARPADPRYRPELRRQTPVIDRSSAGRPRLSTGARPADPRYRPELRTSRQWDSDGSRFFGAGQKGRAAYPTETSTRVT